MNRKRETSSRTKRKETLPHHPEYCGFQWESTCDDCRRGLWPERFFNMTPETRFHVPNERKPFLSQAQLIRSLHYFRNRASVRLAIMDLIFDDVVALVEAILSRRGK